MLAKGSQIITFPCPTNENEMGSPLSEVKYVPYFIILQAPSYIRVRCFFSPISCSCHLFFVRAVVCPTAQVRIAVSKTIIILVVMQDKGQWQATILPCFQCQNLAPSLF